MTPRYKLASSPYAFRAIYCDTALYTIAGDAVSADSIFLTSDIDTMPADGYASAQIVATVFDSLGNHVGSGRKVVFSSTIGQVFPEATLTGASGQVTTFLYSGLDPGECIITATSGGAAENLSFIFLTTSPASINLYSDSLSLTADGYSSCEIRAMVYDSMGHTVCNGTPILFSSTSGTISPPLSYTNNGIATATLTAGTYIGNDTVIAACGPLSDTIMIWKHPGPPAVIYVGISDSMLYAGDSLTSEVAAWVTDELGNPCANGIPVNFSASLGSISPGTAYTDTTGVAISTFHPGIECGTSLIQAQSGSAIGNGTIELIGLPDASILVTAFPCTLVANGSSTSAITAVVHNTIGGVVCNGTPVTFWMSSDSLGYLSPTTALTDSGFATITFRSDTIPGTVRVCASCHMDTLYFVDIVLTAP